jgi:hypothetical protein
MIRYILPSLIILMATAPAQAAAISDAKALDDQELSAISALEQAFFDRLAARGTERAMVETFHELGADQALTPDIIATFRQIDGQCGQLASIERIRSVSFGTRVVQESLVTQQGSCLIKWDMTLVKPGIAWRFDRIQFHTADGNDWTL